jgi:TP901 family phage tail tape measure protein
MAKSLRVEIIGDATSLLSALGKSTTATTGFAASVGRVGTSVAGVGTALTKHVTLPIVALGAVATHMALNFEDAMQRVRTGAGASQGEVNRMSKSIEEMAKTAAGGGQGPQKLAEALYMVESSGLRGGAALKVLSASAVNAQATGTDMTQVVGALTSAVKVQAKGTGDASHAMSTLNAIVGAGKMTFADLTASMKSGILPTSKALGISLPQIGAALGVFTQQGVPAEEAATRLKTALSKMAAPGGIAVKALKELGIGTNDLANALQKGGLTDALELLHQKYEKLKDTKGVVEANRQLLTAFGGARMGGTILQLVQGWSMYQETLARVQKTQGDYAAAAARVMDMPAAKIRVAMSSIQSSMVQIGTALAPTIARIASAIGSLATKFSGLSPSTQRMIGTFALIAAAAGPLLAIVGNLTRMISGLMGAMGALATGSPVAAGFLGIGIAVAALAGHFIFAQIAAERMRQAFQAVQDTANQVSGSIQSLSEANLQVAQAKALVTSTSHQLAAALTAEKQSSDGTTKSTQAEKVAHDNTTSARLAHTQAVQSYQRALDSQDASQKKANETMRSALQPVLAFGAELGKTTGWTGLLGSKIPGLTSAVQKLTFGFIGNSGSQKVSTETAIRWGLGMEAAGRQAFAAAVNTDKLSPAARTSREAMGLLTEAAGRFAREGGKVPTSIGQIVSKAKELHPGIFETTFTAWIKAAQKAGVEIPKWITNAVPKTRTAATNVATGAKAPVASIPGVYGAAGASATARLAGSLNAGALSVAAAAARVAAASKIPLSSGYGSTPGEWGAARGAELIKGWARGILSQMSVASDASDKVKEQSKAKAETQAKELLALANSWGPKIGLAQSTGIVRGLLAGQPSLLQQARQQMVEMQKAMHDKTMEDAGKVGDAFAALADKALAAFDARVSAWKNPLTTKLDNMQAQDAAAQGAKGIADAVTNIPGLSPEALKAGTDIGTTIATAMGAAMSNIMHTQMTGNLARDTAALNRVAVAAQTSVAGQIQAAAQPAIDAANAQVGAAQAALTAAQASGDAEAITKAQQDLNTAVTNRNTLEAAVRAEIERNTGLLAAQTDRRHATIAAHDRAGLQGQLTQTGNYLAKHPALWANMGNAVNKVLTQYGVQHIQPAGKGWAEKFAAGVISGIPAVQRAIDRLVAAAVARIPTTGSPLKPAKEGPLAFHPYDMGRQWVDAWASGMSASSRSFGYSPQGIGAAAGAGGGGDTLHVTMVLNDKVIGEAMYRDLNRRGLRDVKIFAN